MLFLILLQATPATNNNNKKNKLNAHNELNENVTIAVCTACSTISDYAMRSHQLLLRLSCFRSIFSFIPICLNLKLVFFFCPLRTCGHEFYVRLLDITQAVYVV